VPSSRRQELLTAHEAERPEADVMNRVKAAIFSLTPPAGPDDDGSYLRWHLLDHMPEQYQLPGIQYALRYIADGKYLDSRIAAAGHLEQVGNVVNYLVGDPVQQTHDDFMVLGPRLAELGRFPEVRPSLQLRMPALLSWYAAPEVLISPDVVPFRPHRGVLVIVEEPVGEDLPAWLQWLHTDHYPAVLSTPGTSGAWTYGSTTTWNLHPAMQGDPQYISVIYLDDDPLVMAKELTSLVEDRWRSGAVKPLFAGPLRTMIQWEAWR
jgi:hypothetical protein